MISAAKEQALREIILNYANDDSSVTANTLKAIYGVLGLDGDLTIRDQFAMAALTGILSFGVGHGKSTGSNTTWIQREKDVSSTATQAYRWADAMLAARK